MRLREAPGFYAALLKDRRPVKLEARPRKPPGFYKLLGNTSGPTRTSAVKPAARSSRRRWPQKRYDPCKLVHRSRFALSKSEKARVKPLLADPTFHATCGRESVTHADLVGLLPGMWVNDNIINFYAASVMASKTLRRGPKSIFIFSTFFYHQLITAGYTNGRLGRWTKEISDSFVILFQIDIFAKDTVLIPINIENVHWIIAALSFRLKRVEIHDSAHWDHSTVFLLLREYLALEHQKKHNISLDLTEWQDFTAPTPTQTNSYDCGVFACRIIFYLARSAQSFPFVQDDMSDLRERTVLEINDPRLLCA
ncbi:hypothetical protein B0H14DRAFT_2539996 [Mycena olivaceomarginata]|nr:hypothetical protein B0H14DRAFT_2539996 [Mycena olivaceomarginata]